MTFSKNVRRLRVRRGLTQAEVAEGMEVSQGQIANIENGRSNMPVSKLGRLRKFLRCTWAELMRGE